MAMMLLHGVPQAPRIHSYDTQPWLANGHCTVCTLSETSWGILRNFRLYKISPSFHSVRSPSPGGMAAAAAFPFLLLNYSPNPYLLAIKSRISLYTPPLSANPLSYPSPSPPTLLRRTRESFLLFRRCSVVQDIMAEEAEEGSKEGGEAKVEKKRKLYVTNLPWSYGAPDIEKLFGECGTVEKVEIIKQQNGKRRGFVFVTMASGEEARAVIEKFDSYELLGRIIRVEYAKSFRKPSSPSPREIVIETRHEIYASNLDWKVRSVNLKAFFSARFQPLSAIVIFKNQKSAGYGFVLFATKEEAEAAVSEFNGKDLMGRPLRLRISQKKGDESESELGEINSTEGQP